MSDSVFVLTMRELVAMAPSAITPVTARVLARSEALNDFGEEVVECAERDGSVVIDHGGPALPTRLHEARSALDLSIDDVARLAGLSVSTIRDLEDASLRSPYWQLEQYSQVLGIDARLTAPDDYTVHARFKRNAFASPAWGLGPDEAIQLQMALLEARWVGRQFVRIKSLLKSGFEYPQVSLDYGEPPYDVKPTYPVGYRLASRLRENRGLGMAPIPSMTDLCWDIGLPVVLVDMPKQVESALVELGGSRRYVVALSVTVAETRPLNARLAIAHELGHMHDSQARFLSVRVEEEASSRRERGEPSHFDDVEARANAFSVNLIAPDQALKREMPGLFAITSSKKDAVEEASERWGMGPYAMAIHIFNVVPGQFFDRHEAQKVADGISPAVGQFSKEFGVHGHVWGDLKRSRRGRFARLVADAVSKGVLSESSAKAMLGLQPGTDWRTTSSMIAKGGV